MDWPWKKAETDLDREVRFHLESLADSFERQGMTRTEALRRARAEFGGVEQVKERCRDESRWQPLSQLRQDLTFGLRMLRKSPGVTGAAILSLALSIGATTAILSLIDAVLWRQLGVPNPQQLSEVLWQSAGPANMVRSSSGSNYREGPLRVADFFSQSAYLAFRQQTAGRADVAAHRNSEEVSASFNGVTVVAHLRPVSGNFFGMLQLVPALGRLLDSRDDNPAAALAVTVSHRFWDRHLQGDPDIAGRAIRINNRSYVITGVLPKEFTGIVTGEDTGLYTSLEHSPEMLEPNSFYARGAGNPQSWFNQLLIRRSAGVSQEELRPMLDTVFRSTWAEPPKEPSNAPTVRLQNAGGGLGSLRREFGNPLILLSVLVSVVLLISCANIANLLLARADARRKEMALRVSLGSSQGRLVRQFFTESALLAGFGGLLSVPIAHVTANFAVPLMSRGMVLDFTVDARLILATLAVSALTAIAFGLYPAWRASRVDANPALKEGSGSVGGTRTSSVTPGKILVFSQVAMSVLLVTAAAAFTAHLRKILTADTGFERTRLLLFDVRPGQSGYSGPRLAQFYRDLESKLGALPGVQAVGLARIRPMRGGGYFDDMNLPGRAKPIGTAVNFVTADYLTALGVPILAGRGITDQDLRSSASVAVVSEDLAKEIGGNVLGLQYKMDGKPVEIVGIAARARYSRLTEQSNVQYLPNSLAQDTVSVVIRTSVPPSRVLPIARQALSELDKDLPLVNPATMEEQIASTLRRERLFAWLCGAFGVLALVLCTIGLYGIMSYAVERRKQEISIRMALGASPRRVLRHALSEGMSLALLGLLLGGPVAYLAAQKYVDYRRLGMNPVDPMLIFWAVVAMSATALVAVLIPALRAAASDPIQNLRQG